MESRSGFFGPWLIWKSDWECPPLGESSLLVQSGLGHQRLRRLIQNAMVPKAVEALKKDEGM